MSDGAGVVEAVGEGVAEFRPGDHVVSCFFPQWQDGLPRGPVGDFAGTPGDGIDGFAAHFSIRAATAFTHAPRGWSHAEAATITTAGVTAWRALVGDGQIKTGDTVLVLGTGGVSIAALQIAKMTGAAVIATSSSDEKLLDWFSAIRVRRWIILKCSVASRSEPDCAAHIFLDVSLIP